MNWVDWVVVALLLIGLFQGVQRGWVAAIVGIAVIILAFFAAILLLPFYGEGVTSLPMPPEWSRTIAFIIVLLGFYVIISLIANAFLGGKRPRLEAQIPGGILGALRGAVAAMVILGVLAATPAPQGESLIQDINRSRVGKPLLEWERQAMQAVNERIPEISPIGPDRKI
jgi:uncharacterized membrane protein required for colicin V production